MQYHYNAAWRLARNVADDRCLPAKRMAAQGLKGGGLLILGHHANDFAFIGKVERIEPQDLAEGLDFLAHGRCGFPNFDTDARRPGRLVEDCREPASVASRMKRVAGAAASNSAMSSCKAAQSLSIAVESAMSPRALRIAAP